MVPARDREYLPRTRGSLLGQVVLLVVGALSALQLANFTVTVLSVVCLLMVPGFLLMHHRGVELAPLLLAALAWISFLASCVVNDVSVLWPNAVAPASFALYLVGLTVLTGRAVDSVTTVLAGIAVGTVGFFLFEGIELTHTGSFLDLWKYGIAHAVTILILFGLTRTRLPQFVQPLALTLLGSASLGLNFRSHALVCLIAAAVLFTNRALGSRFGRGVQLGAVVTFGLVFAYVLPVVARAGLFGPALQGKILEQEATNLPMLMAGRTEPPMTITAIMDRPFLGWGSAMNITPELYTQAQHLAIRMGYDPTFPFDLYWRLPPTDYSAMHSILLGSWAEGGVLAVLLPGWLLFCALAIVWNNTRFGRWSPLVITVALQVIWDLIYAPWTYNMIAECACLALLFGAVHFRGRTAYDP